MTVAFRIDFEGTNVGDAVTTSTDSDIDGVTGTPTITSESRTGTRAMLCSNLASTLIRKDWGANPITHTLSMEGKCKSTTANAYFLRWGDTSNAIIASLRFGTTTGKIDLVDSGNTARASSSLSWVAGTWYRFECDYNGATPTAPVITVRIYTVFGTAPAETISFTFSTALTFGRVQLGGIGTNTGTRILVIDSVQVAYGIQAIGPAVEVAVGGISPVAKVASPLRTASPIPASVMRLAPLGVAVLLLGAVDVRVNGVRTWTPLPTVNRSAAGIRQFMPVVGVEVAQVRPVDGWGVSL